MPLPLLAMGLGMQAGSSIMSGFFGANQKKNEAAIAKYNAAVMRMRAEAIRMQTKFRQARQAEAGARIQGELRASIGGSGIVSTQGAPLLALALQKSETELENYMIGYEGRQLAEEAENQALEFDMQKQWARIGARQSMIGGFLGAGASGMMAWSQIPKKTTSPINTAGAGMIGMGTGGSGWLTPKNSSYLSYQGIGK